MISVIGEAIVDLVPDPDGTTFHALPGGAPMNVAVAVARLGSAVRFLGRTSGDPFGHELRAHLGAEGVSLDGAPVGDEPTAVALVSLDADGHPSYRFLWDGTADRSVTLDELPADLGDDAALVVGGVSTVLEPGATTIEALVARERGARTVVFDPNVRPQFVTDPAAFRARVEGLTAMADVVKVSDEDLAWLSDEDPLVTAAGWAARPHAGPAHAPLVIVTRGARGPVGFLGDQRVEVPGRSVEVVDTVGAGDSFLGAVVAWLDQHDRLRMGTRDGLGTADVEAMLAFATQVAAVTCTRRGADPPRRDEL